MNATASSWVQVVARATRSAALMTASAPHSTSSREMRRPHAERKSWGTIIILITDHCDIPDEKGFIYPTYVDKQINLHVCTVC